MSAVIKDNLQTSKERDLKYCKHSKNNVDRRNLVIDSQSSRSTRINKGALNENARERVLGGIPQTVPEGTPLIQLLKFLNEEQLYALNQRICETYMSELSEKRMKESGLLIIDETKGSNLRRQEYTATTSVEKSTLQHRPNRYKFADKQN